jgi:glycosyltransferase involved in cell wall biosynthesis
VLKLPNDTLNSQKKVAIIGTVGVPAGYSGFETLAENLVRYYNAIGIDCKLTVYCSALRYSERRPFYLGAKLIYLPLDANGMSSIFYDIWSMLSAAWHRTDVILVLGVSGAWFFPLLRLTSRVKIVTNIDGIEWQREKWSGLAKWFLRWSEWAAVRFSHEVIADNRGITEHVQNAYGRSCHEIAYGGDHAKLNAALPFVGTTLPERYALALCRIEPENNVTMILEAFSNQTELALVFIGNWSNSEFGVKTRERFIDVENIILLDPIYDSGILRSIRETASVYVHGHAAGGTNPSLVEIMHFGIPVAAFDCNFNRYSTENCAAYFSSVDSLRMVIDLILSNNGSLIGSEMVRIAKAKYMWISIAQQYFDLLLP